MDQTGLLQQGGVPGRACLVVMRDPVNSGYDISALSLLLPLSPVCSCIPAKKFLYYAESDKKSFLKNLLQFFFKKGKACVLYFCPFSSPSYMNFNLLVTDFLSQLRLLFVHGWNLAAFAQHVFSRLTRSLIGNYTRPRVLELPQPELLVFRRHPCLNGTKNRDTDDYHYFWPEQNNVIQYIYLVTCGSVNVKYWLCAHFWRKLLLVTHSVTYSLKQINGPKR